MEHGTQPVIEKWEAGKGKGKQGREGIAGGKGNEALWSKTAKNTD